MTLQPYIIQWNVNGIKTRLRLGEIQRLINNYEPICICLQYLGQYDTPLKNCQLASQSMNPNDQLGTAIYVLNKATFETIQIQTAELQYSATKIHLGNGNKITIWNVYNQPAFNYDVDRLRTILNIFAQPVLLVGDLNGHSPLWDENCAAADATGRKIENIIDELDLHCLNEEDTHTYVSSTNEDATSIDLTICTDTLANQLDWGVLEGEITIPAITTQYSLLAFITRNL